MTENNVLELAVKACDDKKAENIVAMDMKGISLMAEYFVICHGNSEKQVQAIAYEVKKAAQEHGMDLKRLEGYDQARWVLIDLGDVIVHVFHKDERLFYNLEKLWGDAPVVQLEGVLR
ncbi:ribosome silencing factor [Alkalihalobacterium bogoriense]|uniref:ribosome silencing factor n=1 Tax=Alkalihalobacterium bogoriense TaxID=246272 RepID=UPI00047DF7BC|nr:ribosome silencing factor [Alkalihalobacterium bogoriense]